METDGSLGLVNRGSAQYSPRLPENIPCRWRHAVGQSGTLLKSRRITGARRERDATNGRMIRGFLPLTDGSDSSMIEGCHGNVTPSKNIAV